MASAQQRVIDKLKSYFTSTEWQTKRTKNAKFTEWIEKLTDKDIIFGHNPTFILAKVKGTSTAVGESTYGNTTTQRTISMEHCTNTKLFVDVSNKADDSTIREAVKRFDYNTTKYYYQKDMNRVAAEDGKLETYRNLRDLNFLPKSYRLNRYWMIYCGDAFKCSLWPIYAKMNDKEIFLGYWEERNKEANIDLQITPPLTPLKKLIITGAVLIGLVAVSLIFIL